MWGAEKYVPRYHLYIRRLSPVMSHILKGKVSIWLCDLNILKCYVFFMYFRHLEKIGFIL